MAIQFEAIGVVDQAVEYGIGECGFVDDVVPCGDRELAGDQDRASPMAVLDDLHEIAALSGVQAIGAPIIENEQVSFHKGSEQAGKASVAMGQVEIGEQAGQPLIDDGEVVAAGFLAQGAGKPGLPDPAGAGDHQVAGVFDPASGGELLERDLVRQWSEDNGRAPGPVCAVCGSRRLQWLPRCGAALPLACGSGTAGCCG